MNAKSNGITDDAKNSFENSIEPAEPETSEFALDIILGRTRYCLDDRGLWWIPSQGDKEAHPVWLAAPFTVEAKCLDDSKENSALDIRFTDSEGNDRQAVIYRRDILKQGSPYLQQLADMDLKVGTTAKAKLHLNEYLMHVEPSKRVRLVNQPGWYKEKVYVLPGRTIGVHIENNKEVGIYLASSYAYSDSLYSRGTLEEWKKNVSALCVGNYQMMFTLSVAFAGPLLKLINEKSGGFHLSGNSTAGKSTCIYGANSVWSDPDSVGSWDGTKNGIKAAAAASNDRLLILDEIAECDPKQAGQIIYGIGNSVGKKRANNFGGSQAPAPAWRNIVLSTGELTLKALFNEINQPLHAGQEVRLADIPVEKLFHNLHGEIEEKDFADRFNQACHQFYGTAGPLFIESIVQRIDTLSEQIKLRVKSLIQQMLPEKNTSAAQLERVARRFALAGIAGELATEWGITGWQNGMASEAAKLCLHDFIDLRGTSGSTEERDLLAHVRLFLERNGRSQFLSINASKDEKIINQAGYRDQVKLADETLVFTDFLFTQESFKSIICKHHSHKFVTETLAKNKFLERDSKGKNSESIYVPAYGGNLRLYRIKATILDE